MNAEVRQNAAEIVRVLKKGPIRVVIDSDGTAVPAWEAKNKGVNKIDIIFIRQDGWSIGAPANLAPTAGNIVTQRERLATIMFINWASSGRKIKITFTAEPTAVYTYETVEQAIAAIGVIGDLPLEPPTGPPPPSKPFAGTLEQLRERWRQ